MGVCVCVCSCVRDMIFNVFRRQIVYKYKLEIEMVVNDRSAGWEMLNLTSMAGAERKYWYSKR